VVNPGDPATALTTLAAVHNPLGEAIVVHASFRPNDGSEIVEEEYDLPAHATWTRNLRDVAAGALRMGSLIVTATKVSNGQAVPIGGDYFVIDPGQNFASGNELLDWTDGGCELWDARMLNGGAFDGGTRFFFYTPDNPPGPLTHLIAVGDVYTEAGVFAGVLQVRSTGSATEIAASEIAGLPAFAAIEWTLVQGKGAIMTTFSAAGRYSVGVSSICRDPVSAASSLRSE
jgi:hypothetical protein